MNFDLSDLGDVITGAATGAASIITALNAPPQIKIPSTGGTTPAQTIPVGTGVGSALQQGKTNTSSLIVEILLGAAATVLVLALVLVRKK